MNRQNLASWLLGIVGVLSIACGAALLGQAAATAPESWSGPPPVAGAPILFRVAAAEGDDPSATGKKAAESLKKAMAGAPLKAVIISECYEGKQAKEKLLAGVSSVLPAALLCGGATYGSFTQSGCTDADAVCLLGIGGEGVSVSAALVTGLGTAKLTFQDHRAEIESRLHAAGEKLAERLRRSEKDRLLLLIPDAHAPKNQPLVEGVQKVLGAQFPITGGCANKNEGQTFVYFGGRAYEDSAVALMLSGDFKTTLAGRQGKDNDRVIASAGEGAAQALAEAQGKPIAVLAFNCAGRRSKLKRMEDELAAMQKAMGKELPLFGCYCAGEIGPVDGAEKKPGALCGGSGWHVMFTVIGR